MSRDEQASKTPITDAADSAYIEAHYRKRREMSKEPMAALDGVDIEAHYNKRFKEIDDGIAKRNDEIRGKASYFVADLLSDGVVDNDEEVLFLLAIIECATFHIAQKEEERYEQG